MNAESRASNDDPTLLGPTFVLTAIDGLPGSEQKASILYARELGLIDDVQTEILIRVLGLAAE